MTGTSRVLLFFVHIATNKYSFYPPIHARKNHYFFLNQFWFPHFSVLASPTYASENSPKHLHSEAVLSFLLSNMSFVHLHLRSDIVLEIQPKANRHLHYTMQGNHSQSPLKSGDSTICRIITVPSQKYPVTYAILFSKMGRRIGNSVSERIII